MRVSKLLIFIIPAILFASAALLQSGNKPEAPASAAKPVVFKRVLSAEDSLIFRYDTILTHLLESAKNVGAAAVITINGEVKYLKCFGVKKAGENDEVDAGTIFRLASVSKPITGIFAGIMANDSLIGLDEKVIDFLPDFYLKDTLSTSQLSVRHLLSHTSGLVPHAYDNLIEDGVPFNVIIDSLHRVNISAPPGQLYGYQNVLFSIYDTISVLRSGQSFEKKISERLFKPFNMYHASAGLDGFTGNKNFAYPHGRYGNSYKPIRLNTRYYNTNPAAGINASISDLGNFLTALTDPRPDIINSAVIDSILTPQVRSPLKWIYLRHWDKVQSKHYGLGWRLIGYHDRTIAYHGGYVRGYRAEIALCREEGIGIAFLTNSPGRAGSKVVPEFLDMYFESQAQK
ncbi:MAG TPA: serine hydrolase domain-containing protein [Bacteroidales bacterium]|nr:serine hydrolase domain-containing protein [Bacteroidales bacterium]